MNSIEWCGNAVRFIDQSKLPLEEIYVTTDDYHVVAEAIRSLKIRGAPLIGIAAAYGIALAAIKSRTSDRSSFVNDLQEAKSTLAATRPTAVNLFWALEKMESIFLSDHPVEVLRLLVVDKAQFIHRKDAEQCRLIGKHGAELVPQNSTILTHCNTGALATGGEGTAQSIITTAHGMGKNIKVFADETRPLLQGARLTAWELKKAGVDVTLITDNTAAFMMQRGKVDLVVTGADRIAANGDTANKIGTYNLAVLAKHHHIPMYIAAPTTTIDPTISSGDSIPIEERNEKETTEGFGRRIAPEGINVVSPAFDITPAELITAIITDCGVFRPPFKFQ